MNTWKTANAVSEQGYSLYVSLVDGRRFIVDAPLEGDVRLTPCVRTSEGGLALQRDLEAELTDAGFDVHRTLPTELRVRDGGAW